jgi:hypothetical protein
MNQTGENNWLVPPPNLITRANAKYRTMLKQYRSGGVRVMVFNALIQRNWQHLSHKTHDKTQKHNTEN